MASPLSLFRQHQKILLAVFGVMIIMVFTVGGVVQQYMQTTPQGSYGRDVVLTWSKGTLKRRELDTMRRNHNDALKYMGAIMQKTVELGGRPGAGAQFMNGRQFQIPGILNDVSDAAAIRIMLMAAKADKMGLVVSDKAITEFLKELSDGKLGEGDLAELLKETLGRQYTQLQMWRQLKVELLSKAMTRMASSGIGAITPGVAWKYHNRLRRRVTAQLLPLPVGDFVGEVGNPTDAQVEEFFEKHKGLFAFPQSPTPGFRVRLKKAFQFLRADFNKMYLDPAIAQVTEQEVKDYYEKNKENYVDTSLPSVDAGNRTSEFNTGDEKKGDDPPPTPGKKDDPPAPPGKKGTDSKKSAAKKADTSKSGKKKAKPANPQDKAGAKTKGPAKKKATTKKKSPSTGKKKASKTGQIRQQDQFFVAFGKGEKKNTAAKKKAVSKGGKKKTPVKGSAKKAAPTTKKKSSTSKKSSTKKGNDKKGGSSKKKSAPPEPPKKRYKPLNEALKKEIRSTIAMPVARAKMHADMLKARSVVERLGRNLTILATVEDQLTELNLDKGIKKSETTGRLAKAFSRLDRNNDGLLTRDERYPKLTTADFQKVGVPFELSSTPIVKDPNDKSKMIASAIDELQAADAAEKGNFDLGLQVASSFPREIKFTDIAFNENTNLYQPELIPRARKFGTNNETTYDDVTYMYWTVREEKSHIPVLADVRQDVIDQWKLRQAVAKAKAKAEELQKKATEEAKKGSPTFSLVDIAPAEYKTDVIEIPNEVSWFSRGSVPFSFFDQGPKPSEIPGVRYAGNKFMETMFSLEKGEVGVSLDQPETTAYVIRVVTVSPSVEVRREQFMASFDRGPPPNPNAPTPAPDRQPRLPRDVQILAQQESQQIMFEWFQSLEQEFNVKVAPQRQPEE